MDFQLSLYLFILYDRKVLSWITRNGGVQRKISKDGDRQKELKAVKKDV